MNATIESMSDSAHLYWEAQAATFDDEPDHGLLHPEIRDGWRRLLLEHLLPAPADVIDLGCGTGTLSVLLAESGYRVRGLDFAAAMISAATMKAAMASVQVTFQRGDAARPPYQPASCDVVLCRHLLWAVPDPTEALRRWCELLRPGGRLLLIEGRWSTGGGIPASDCERLVRRHHSSVILCHLDEESLWGRPIEDERYLIVSTD
jgi:ubiquinone/menaquinone biosynthesis C-methylase UbiE